MTKKYLFTIAIVLLGIASYAQNSNTRLNIGIPLGKYGKFDHNFTNSDESNSPSVIIQLEKQWDSEISIGAYIGYAGQKHKFGTDEMKYNYYRVGGSLTYELNELLDEINLQPAFGIEMYAGAKVGLSWENEKHSWYRPDNSGNAIHSDNTDNNLLFDLGVLVGSRYYFNDSFGIFAELGWGNAGFFTIGTTFNL